MSETKKKRRRSKGWGVGSRKDALTPVEDAFLEMRLRLAEGLRARRIQQNLTQKAFASALGSSQSRVAKMESGDSAVSVDLLIRGLLALGAMPRDLASVITAARTVPVRYAVGEKRAAYRLDHAKARQRQRRNLAEDAEDLVAYRVRAKEPRVKLETVVKGLRRRGRL